MTIQVRVDPFSLPLATPVLTARGAVTRRDGVVIVVHDEEGHWGRGEVAPLPGWSAVTLDQLSGSLDDLLGGLDQVSTDVPELRAGIDTARWSLRAAQRGVPLWREIATRDTEGSGRAEVIVNTLIVGSTPTELAESAQAAQAAGQRCLKVKLGMPDDQGRLAALADVLHPDVRVRLDANAALDAEAATDLANSALAILGARLDYIEDPVASLDQLGSWRSDVAVGVDELVRSQSDLDQALALAAVKAIVIKPAMLGGISPCINLTTRAHEAGAEVVFSSLYDGPIGLSAWCHLAYALAPTTTHGLGTANLFAPGIADHLVANQGRIRL